MLGIFEKIAVRPLRSLSDKIAAALWRRRKLSSNRSNEILHHTFYEYRNFKRPEILGDAALSQEINSVISNELHSGGGLEVRLFRSHEVELFGDWGFIHGAKKHPLIDLMSSAGWSQNHFDIYKKMYQRQMMSAPRRKIEQTAVNLLWPGIMTYGHWLLDTIPRLEYLRSSGVDLKDCIAILPENTPDYMKQIINAYGLSEYVETGNEQNIHFREIYTPSHTRHPLFLPDTLYKPAYSFIRQTLCDDKNPTNVSANKLYLHHTPMTSKINDPRALENEDEVSKHLTQKGYTTYNPVDFSFGEQIEAFRSTLSVAGVDSSALHNVIFSDPNILENIIAFCPPWRVNYNHVAVASLTGARVWLVRGEARGNNGAFHMPKRALDLLP